MCDGKKKEIERIVDKKRGEEKEKGERTRKKDANATRKGRGEEVDPLIQVESDAC